ncbi:hypothetical protein BVRB_8g186330 [Beta vulgaris subsp. vulgaris]|uniref:Uncharacterized protein n=1 Tax=Beta vulgaris subsp. vulgaris TaxID=3555 RepID=A0A0J8BSB7_BETVV|nr:hypothetical protein BVRB_8g186330 [Beta vulgaris subsp. vulgaris]
MFGYQVRWSEKILGFGLDGMGYGGEQSPLIDEEGVREARVLEKEKERGG